MKKITFIGSVFLALFFLSQNVQAQKTDQATFEKFLRSAYSAFDENGWDGLKAFYAPNAFEIGPDGKMVSGMIALEANYNEFEAMMDNKPKFTYQLTSWRLIKPDIALITWDSKDEFQINGQEIITNNTCTALLRKAKKKWLIESMQLTPQIEMAAPDMDSDEDAIQAMLNEAYDAFADLDAESFAAIFTEDAVFISPEGVHLKGRKAIEEAHAALFESPLGEILKNQKVEILNKDLRFLDADHALLTWTDKSSGIVDGQWIEEQSQIVILALRQGDTWLTASCQITPVVHAPMPTASKKN